MITQTINPLGELLALLGGMGFMITVWMVIGR